MEASKTLEGWEMRVHNFITTELDVGVDPDELVDVVEGAIEDYGNEAE